MLQMVLIRPWGPWQVRYERSYQKALKEVPILLEPAKNQQAYQKMLKEIGQERLSKAIIAFDRLRLARLAAYLRQREPDDSIGYSILIYRLTEEDVRAALYGRPAELEPTPDLGP